jgi:hypothetical protein
MSGLDLLATLIGLGVCVTIGLMLWSLRPAKEKP